MVEPTPTAQKPALSQAAGDSLLKVLHKLRDAAERGRNGEFSKFYWEGRRIILLDFRTQAAANVKLAPECAIALQQFMKDFDAECRQLETKYLSNIADIAERLPA